MSTTYKLRCRVAWSMAFVKGHHTLIPLVVCQLLLQLCYPVEFVKKPLIYGRQLVDLINTHTAMESLKGTSTGKRLGIEFYLYITSKIIW